MGGPIRTLAASALEVLREVDRGLELMYGHDQSAVGSRESTRKCGCEYETGESR